MLSVAKEAIDTRFCAAAASLCATPRGRARGTASSSFESGDGGVSNSTVAFFPSVIGGSADTDTGGGGGAFGIGGGGGASGTGGGGGPSGTAGSLFAPVLGDLDSTDGVGLGLVAGFGLPGGSFAFSSFTLVDDLLFLGGFGSSEALWLLAGLVGGGTGLIGDGTDLVGDGTGLAGDGMGLVGGGAGLVVDGEWDAPSCDEMYDDRLFRRAGGEAGGEGSGGGAARDLDEVLVVVIRELLLLPRRRERLSMVLIASMRDELDRVMRDS